MADIHNLDDHRPHCVIESKKDGKVFILSHKQIQEVADGRTSIAEYEDPEAFARTLAIMVMGMINGN